MWHFLNGYFLDHNNVWTRIYCWLTTSPWYKKSLCPSPNWFTTPFPYKLSIKVQNLHHPRKYTHLGLRNYIFVTLDLSLLWYLVGVTHWLDFWGHLIEGDRKRPRNWVRRMAPMSSLCHRLTPWPSVVLWLSWRWAETFKAWAPVLSSWPCAVMHNEAPTSLPRVKFGGLERLRVVSVSWV